MFSGNPGCGTQPPFVIYRKRSRGPAGVALVSLSLAASFVLGCGRPARADALSGKGDLFVARTLAAKPRSGWSSVIVKVGGELTGQRDSRIRSLGGYVYRHLPLVRSVAVRVPARNLPRLASFSFVRRLSADLPVRKNDEFTVERSGADVAFGQYKLTGDGVTVAVVDSGVRSHPDLSDTSGGSRVLHDVNFVSGADEADDACGHGTHVAGIIAGNGKSSTGPGYFRTFYGIARKANLVNVRVLDEQGQGTVSSVLAGIQWAVDNRAEYNIRVMNLSLGHPVGESYATDPLCQAVEQAWKAGIVVVCAAGNGGRLQDTPDPCLDNEGYGAAYGSIQSPGNSPYAITVGAMKSTDGGRDGDRIATYSGRGPTRLDFVLKPDLVAPGNHVIALNSGQSYLESTYSGSNLVPLSDYAYTDSDTASGKYFRLSGTSMAAPVVSGAAALLLEADPALSPDTVKARLMVSADKWGFPDGGTDACTFGAGYLNIPAALECAVVATGPAVSPLLVRDEQGDVFIDPDSILWGADIEDLQVIWGTQILWGTGTLSNSQILWGAGVWADQVIWGESTGAVDLSSTAINGED